jgi:excisionase family DNA binding protein
MAEPEGRTGDEDGAEHGPMLKAPEVARRLGISEDTVYRKTAAGKIPHFRIDDAIRYSWDEVYETFHRGPAAGKR